MVGALLDIENLSVDFRTADGRVHALRDVALGEGAARSSASSGSRGRGKSTLVNAVIGLLAANAEVTGGRIGFKGADLLGDGQGCAATAARRSHHRRVPGSDDCAQPGAVDRHADGRDPVPFRAEPRGEAAAQHRDAWKGPHPRSGAAAAALSAPVLRRHAAARLHRHGADARTRPVDRRRTHHRARRDAGGAGDPPAQGAAGGFGCSIVFVSHHLGAVAELCDSVAIMYAGEIVEFGSVRQIFHDPRHPYTRKLIECDPGRIAGATRSLPTIPGEVPSLIAVPQGCIFRGRCPDRIERCSASGRGRHALDGEHLAACHRAERIAAA